MKLKVCGMKYQDNMKAVADLQPDYLGFIFHEESPRHFNGTIPNLPSTIKKVGVFVDKDLEFVRDQVKTHKLDAIQLHGQETPELCRKLNSKELEIIKVFSIKDKFDFSVLKDYENVVDYYLFDTKGALPGGNGYAFDWTVLKDYPSTKRFFLSGGIGLEQKQKLKKFKSSPISKYCYAIDVNSKFEIEPGLKNIKKLKEFKSQI